MKFRPPEILTSPGTPLSAVMVAEQQPNLMDSGIYSVKTQIKMLHFRPNSVKTQLQNSYITLIL